MDSMRETMRKEMDDSEAGKFVNNDEQFRGDAKLCQRCFKRA